MEKTKALFTALLQECKVKEVHNLVEIVCEMTPNRKDACEIIGIPYDSATMKECSRNVFARRAAGTLKRQIIAPLFGA